MDPLGELKYDGRRQEEKIIRPCSRLSLAVVTLAVVMLTFLAFDDITTGNQTGFTAEYSFLLAATLWCLVVAMCLIRTRHFVPGGTSVAVLVAAIWGQRSVGPGTVPGWEPEYVATVAALGWFLVLSIWLLIQVRFPSRASASWE
ncbi:MAG TPA: hypothetical protein VFL57_13015 [Bryobacteraceae bacterium]|nr:hypothetical protein [Bryobacteraceae bacterium]